MTYPIYRVSLLRPDGETLDVEDRIDLSELGVLTESPEEILLELVHGDISFHLRDTDGIVESFFQGVTPDQVYEVVIERQIGSGPFDRVFGGVLDLPWSLQYERKQKRVAVQAFSYSKLLERTSAELVRRIVTGRTGSVSSGSKIVTCNSTTDLLPGDTISLANSVTMEDQVINTVDSGTQVTTVANWSSTFSSATLTLETPYYRSKSIQYLGGLLFNASGIPDHQIDVEQEVSSYPISTPLSTQGLPLGVGTAVRSLIQDPIGRISVGHTSGRFVAPNPTDGFTTDSGDSDGQGDWRPYLLTPPSSVPEFAVADTGEYAWDHIAVRRYGLIELIEPANSRLFLTRNGLSLPTHIDLWSDPSDVGWDLKFLEYDSINDRVWISYRRQGDASATKIYELSSDTLISAPVPIQGMVGRFRSIRSLGLMVFLENGTTNLHLCDIASVTRTRVVQVPVGLIVWTLRSMGDIIVALYAKDNVIRLIVWDTDWVEVTNYTIGSPITGNQFLTVWTDANGMDIGIGFAAGQYFVLAPYFSGVVPYADFDGMSCSAALRELAIISLSLIRTDHNKVGYLTSRSLAGNSEDPIYLGTPLERETTPLWEDYSASVQFRGETESGVEIIELAGDTGDSARRLELGSKMATTPSLVFALASSYASFFSVIRSQEDVRVEEPGRIVRVFDRVLLDGKEYSVIEADLTLELQEQDLRLIEVT